MPYSSWVGTSRSGTLLTLTSIASRPAVTSDIHTKAADFQQACRYATTGKITDLVERAAHQADGPMVMLATLAQWLNPIYKDVMHRAATASEPAPPVTVPTPRSEQRPTQSGKAPREKKGGDVTYYCSVHGTNSSHSDKDCRAQRAQSHATVTPPAAAPASLPADLMHMLRDLQSQVSHLTAQSAHTAPVYNRPQPPPRAPAPNASAEYQIVVNRDLPLHLLCGRWHRPDQPCYGPDKRAPANRATSHHTAGPAPASTSAGWSDMWRSPVPDHFSGSTISAHEPPLPSYATKKVATGLPKPFLPLPITAELLASAPHAAPAAVTASVVRSLTDQLTTTILHLQQQLDKLQQLPSSQVNVAWPSVQGVYHLNNPNPREGVAALDSAGHPHLLPRMLLDNCSSLSLVNAEVVRRLRLPLVDQPITFTQSSGATHQLQHVVQLPLLIAHGTPYETNITLAAAVTPASHYDVLLGNDFNSALAAYVDPAAAALVLRPYWQSQADSTTHLSLPVSMHTTAALPAPLSSQGGEHAACGPPGTQMCHSPLTGSGNNQRGAPRTLAERGPGARSALTVQRGGHWTSWLGLSRDGASSLGCPSSTLGTAPCLIPSPNSSTAVSSSDRWEETTAGILLNHQMALASNPIDAFSPDGGLELPPGPYHKHPTGFIVGTNPSFPASAMTKLTDYLQLNRHHFAWSLSDLPGYQSPLVPPMRILLDTPDPIVSKVRRYSDLQKQVEHAKVKELLEAGIIAPVTHDRPCNYASCPTMPAKRDAEGNWTDTRYCLDFRPLNAHTLTDRYRPPNIDELFQKLKGSKYWTKLDLRQGFLQCPVAECDQLKTAFWVGNKLFYYKRMPFGLRNATAYFQRVMDTELSHAGLDHCAVCFVDDVCIHSATPEQHVLDVQAVLEALSSRGLLCHPDKCQFALTHMEFLGHLVTPDGISPQTAKVKAILDMPEPANVPELRSVLGMIAYYSRYIPGLSDIAAPLYKLTRKDEPWQWGAEQKQALDKLLNFASQADYTGARLDVVACTIAILPLDWVQPAPVFALSLPLFADACCADSLHTNHSSLVPTAEETVQDVWDDAATLLYLQHTTITNGTKASETARIKKRAAHYQWSEGQLYRALPSGAWRQVPPPAARKLLIQRLHEATGHYGVRRTTHLVRLNYWWVGLVQDVCTVVKGCPTCDRVKTTLNARPMQLQSLPIMGLCYRWGCDLAGDLPLTKRGNTYVLVCIEHLSKWVECIPIPDKRAATVAYAFLHHVLARYAAPAEVLTDGGSEFQGEFSQQLQQAHIDHRVTSANHPQADGLAERAVQTIKRALRKACDSSVTKDSWDELLPWIMLGYRCSPQSSTKLSPYEIMLARPPVIPSAHRRLYDCQLDFSDPAIAADSVLLRAAAAQDSAAMAANNLLVAQHRDQARYRHIRSGHYRPPLTGITPGMFVYRRVAAATTLHPSVGTAIFRVVHVFHNGRARLAGSDGQTFEEHVCNLAPCHANVDLTPFQPDLVPAEDHACSICGSPEQADIMLLCDKCGGGYHTTCLTPPLSAIPTGDWFCPACQRAGITSVELQQLRQHQQRLSTRAAPRADSADKYRQLDGRWCIRPASAQHHQASWGQVQYLGESSRPQCFKVHFTPTDIAGPMSLTQLRRLKWLQAPGSAPGG